MSFKSTNLSVLAYANNFTLWHYTTTDKLSTVLEAKYFNSKHNYFAPNDLIICISDTDGSVETKFIIVTQADEDGTVSVELTCQ